MSSTENSYQNVIAEHWKEAVSKELDINKITDYLQNKGMHLDETDTGILETILEFIEKYLYGRSDLFFDLILNLEYVPYNKLAIDCRTYIRAFFSMCEDKYFYNKCGNGFLLNSNSILIPQDGEAIENEVEQDKVGLAALVMQATYSKRADPQKAGIESQNDESIRRFDAVDSAYRRAFITMPEHAYIGDMPKTEDAVYDSLKAKKGFTVVDMKVHGYGFALLTHGVLPTKSENDHEYYVMAIRGTTPIMFDPKDPNHEKLPSNIKVEKWVREIYTERQRFQKYLVKLFFQYLVNINPTDFMNNVLAEPVAFNLPGSTNAIDGSLVHEGFYTKASLMFSKLKTGEVTFGKNNNTEKKTLREVLKDIIENEKCHLIITGHSQGAAVALALSALIRLDVLKSKYAGLPEITEQNIQQVLKRMELITFAQPSVGNESFIKICQNVLGIAPNYKHFVREGDLVAMVPGDSWNEPKESPDVAKHFGKMLFESVIIDKGKETQRRLNPIKHLEHEITLGKLFGEKDSLFSDLTIAHNAGSYLARVYNHYSKHFAAKWPVAWPWQTDEL